MDKEIEIFKKLLFFNRDYFGKMGYTRYVEEIYNVNSLENIFCVCSFCNDELSKKITFTFCSSVKESIEKVIEVYLTENNSTSIDIPTFLAYKELKRKIRHEDTEKYWFKVDPKRLEESIQEQLAKIIALLNTDLHKIFTTDEWIDIPTHDPRDDY